MKGGSLPGIVSRISGGFPPLPEAPAPFEAVMAQMPKRCSVPGDEKFQSRLVASDLVCARPGQQVALCPLAFPIPAILAGKRPDRVRSGLGRPIFFNEPRRYLRADRLGDRGCVFAAQPKGLQTVAASAIAGEIVSFEQLQRRMSGASDQMQSPTADRNSPAASVGCSGNI
ncbi:hypothetical protein [Bosea sp. (in: a-proteobacteria)]|uniref:hypothetical protein n=1 Tax=Bosea sp. (in: a-proteobacteria) TaxID=1871050 RepID=UPI0025B9E4E3|nr:hypothetical protein [Bosea sp. (in: a-proteobacteria)]